MAAPSPPNMLRFYARAERYLWERNRLDEATESEIESLANALKMEEFRRVIEPYERHKRYIASRFLALQLPGQPLPQTVQDALAQWDEMILIEARKWGYEVLP